MADVQEDLWWKYKRSEIFEKLKSSNEGLTATDAEKRLLKYGLNTIVSKSKIPSFIKILVSQFSSWLVIILIIASLVSFFLGEPLDSAVIMSYVILSAVFGFIQEFKAESAVEKVKEYLSYKCKVLRDGNWTLIDNKFIVPGDIVEVRLGDKISADIRLIKSDGLSVDESILTGESIPVEKNDTVIDKEKLNISDQKNMIFMGTTVSSGFGSGIVIATGLTTSFGSAQKLFSEKTSSGDFQVQIKSFSQFLFKVIVILTFGIFLVNALLAKDLVQSFLFAVALAIGITPEMLPAIITVTLSQGAMKMAKKKVIVKKLSAVEDFGNLDTLCMDKTGTLTEGKFSLVGTMNVNGNNDESLYEKALICTSKFSQNSKDLKYDAHDEAIWESEYTQKYVNKLTRVKFVSENIFDYERRRMSISYEKQGEYFLVAKGSPETMLEICSKIAIGEKSVNRTNKEVKNINDQIAVYEEKAYRVILLAEKKLEKKSASKADENDMVFLGYLLFKDPVKESAGATIAKFEKLGIDLKIISGDSLVVTVNIARETGIDFNDRQVISGNDLEKLSPDEFNQAAREKKIFARITPEQKYKIIKALNYEGHIVGFLGDGINDAGALREADVGISVDTGADIAKDASDIILLKKDLNVLAEGIEAGRKTFGNIMKYILNTISANYGNMFTVAISSFFLKFIPLLPSQILLNNFVSDIPLFAVATDNVDENFLRKPKKWNIGFIKNFMIYYGFVSSFFDMLLILPMIFILKVEPEVFRTAWFVESAISEILVTFAIRTKLPFYKSKPSNWLLVLSVLSITLVISMSVLQVNIFHFTTLPYLVWVLIIFDLISYFVVTEIVKKSFFKKFEV
ncbi:MAG: Magnesium-translocating P-type ATPase [Microgenomates group bacterium GW2011_GWC1_37_12b]|uniref:Magnesium-transporting ATPase, P-type 1 n=1 Tax=Candidatus Woesebacteria bacterium GW2011_GWB1_38_8b TaxID=1618571 RepID=A0A0G0PBG2_9BACT|nr:MAG: Magnesium-translocating P-type ATPase [Microgenomates group bacterium GW2011_GWC1_37_12b]KKQ86591.1 MAG: Magnesium-translocating P-type ATPase [Candidatus Woesebacteria bacterium GW2011_GWB1_38_8b]